MGQLQSWRNYENSEQVYYKNERRNSFLVLLFCAIIELKDSGQGHYFDTSSVLLFCENVFLKVKKNVF